MGSKTPFPRLRPKQWTLEQVSAYPELVKFLDELDDAVKSGLIHNELLRYSTHFAGYVTVAARCKNKIGQLRKYIAMNHPHIDTAPSPMSDYSFLYKFEIKDASTR